MQKVFIIGNLTADPELRTTTTGKNVCTFTVAVNRRNEGADFFRVSAWETLGENCNKFLTKGRKVAVVGSVSVRAYTLKNGDPAASLELSAQEVEFLSPRSESPENTVKQVERKDEQTGFTVTETDDLPF